MRKHRLKERKERRLKQTRDYYYCKETGALDLIEENTSPQRICVSFTCKRKEEKRRNEESEEAVDKRRRTYRMKDKRMGFDGMIRQKL